MIKNVSQRLQIKENRDEYFIVTKGTIHKEDKIIINIYTSKKIRNL